MLLLRTGRDWNSGIMETALLSCKTMLNMVTADTMTLTGKEFRLFCFRFANAIDPAALSWFTFALTSAPPRI